MSAAPAPPRPQPPLTIVGAGPAGLAAAIVAETAAPTLEQAL